MIHKRLIQSAALFILIILIAGCRREEFSWGIKIGDITYSGNVVFLGERELSSLNEITSDQMVFTDKTGEIEKITDKSILVIGISENTPYGSLRKVNSIHSEGNLLTVRTVPALLPDAIKEGKINLKRKLLEKDFRLKFKADGVKIKDTSKSFEGLAVTLDKLSICDDGACNAVIDGAVGITTNIDIGMDFKSNRLTGIVFATTLEKIDEVTLTSTRAFSGASGKVAAEFIHSPIIIDSLVFVAEVKIHCGFKGTASSAITSGVRQDRTISTAARYLSASWSDDRLAHSENFDYITPLVTDAADLKVITGPEITVFLFGIPVQTIKADAYYSVNAQKDNTPSWKLFSGLDGHVTVNNEILGMGQDHILSMVIQASEIASAGGK
ncbi:MAG: hypothetical protein GT598_05715 [Bacteroidales bacterium]|nr:hypothetical protein [Bacteroidales bacterium]HPM18281.1 hypothetical protein [Bacteroidales bacterium]